MCNIIIRNLFSYSYTPSCVMDLRLMDSELELIEKLEREQQIQNEKYFALHRGHELQHQEMAVIFIVVLLGSQLGIFSIQY